MDASNSTHYFFFIKVDIHRYFIFAFIVVETCFPNTNSDNTSILRHRATIKKCLEV